MQENKKYSKDGKRIFTPATPEDGKFGIACYEHVVVEKDRKEGLETVVGNSTKRTNPLSNELEQGMSIVATSGKPENLKEDKEERE